MSKGRSILLNKPITSAVFLGVVFWYNDEKKSTRDMFLDECEDITDEVADESASSQVY